MSNEFVKLPKVTSGMGRVGAVNGFGSGNANGQIMTTGGVNYGASTLTTKGGLVIVLAEFEIYNLNSGFNRTCNHMITVDGSAMTNGDSRSVTVPNGAPGTSGKILRWATTTPSAGSHTFALNALCTAASSCGMDSAWVSAFEIGLSI